MIQDPKVAIVYDKATTWGGAERVLVALAGVFPGCTLFASAANTNLAWLTFFSGVKTSFIDKLPGARKKPQIYELLMPCAFSMFDFQGFDLVISVSSYSAHHIFVPARIPHLHYYLTPSRYLWVNPGYADFKGFGVLNPLVHFLKTFFLPILRVEDQLAARRADTIVSISKLVQKRVKKFYQRGSEVIYPPVNTDFFVPDYTRKRKHFLYVGRLTGYKAVEIVVTAFATLPYQLIIVGEGESKNMLRDVSQNVTFLGTTDDEQLKTLYQEAYGTIMPQPEDFGLVAAESLACGTPVIVHKDSGIAELVTHGKNAIVLEQLVLQDIHKAIESALRLTKSQSIVSDCVFAVQEISEHTFKLQWSKVISESLREMEKNYSE